MKNLYKIKTFLLTASISLSFCASAFAFPMVSESVKITDGMYGTTSGGEFNLDIKNDGDINYISFCVELTEYVSLGGVYKIASVTDKVYGGGTDSDTSTSGYDTLGDDTQWVVYNYLYGSFTNGTSTISGRSLDLANKVQNIIWYLEDEQKWTDLNAATRTFYTNYIDGKTSSVFNDYVTVLNLVDTTTGAYQQSQIIADPVPEPTTMLLFGTGLAGLAGIARRRVNR